MTTAKKIMIAAAINRGRFYTVKVGTLTVQIKAKTATEAVAEAKERLGNYAASIVDIKEVA